MKYLVIGLGSMGKRRVRHLIAFNHDIIGFDIRQDRCDETHEKFNIPVFLTFEAAVKEQPDVFFICAPPVFHAEYMKYAVNMKKHFFVEKPVSHSLDFLEEILIKANANGKVALPSYNMRNHICVRKIKELLDMDLIGPVITGFSDVGEYLPDWHPYEDYRVYYPSKKALGGWIDHACEFEWLMWLLGDISRISTFGGKLSSLDVDTYDVLEVMLEFRGGAILGLHTDLIQRQYNRSLKLIGEKGTIVWDGVTNTIKVFDPAKRSWVVYFDSHDENNKKYNEDMYVEETRHFIQCILGKEKPANTLEREIHILKIMLAMFESAEKNLHIAL